VTKAQATLDAAPLNARIEESLLEAETADAKESQAEADAGEAEDMFV
jgi:hypothetical protein